MTNVFDDHHADIDFFEERKRLFNVRYQIQKLQDQINIEQSKKIQRIYRKQQYKKDNYGFWNINTFSSRIYIGGAVFYWTKIVDIAF